MFSRVTKTWRSGEAGTRLTGKKSSIRNLFSMICFILLSSCSKKVKFNAFEKSLLDVYEEGDTLIFESSKAELDTVYIIRKEISYADWNPLAHSGEYKTLSGKIYYAREWLPNGEPDIRQFIALYKDEPDSASLDIFYNVFLGIKFGSNSPPSLLRYSEDDGETFRFRIIRSNKGSTTEKVLYWHVKHGIVRFITEEGTNWVCISCTASDR